MEHRCKARRNICVWALNATVSNSVRYRFKSFCDVQLSSRSGVRQTMDDASTFSEICLTRFIAGITASKRCKTSTAYSKLSFVLYKQDNMDRYWYISIMLITFARKSVHLACPLIHSITTVRISSHNIGIISPRLVVSPLDLHSHSTFDPAGDESFHTLSVDMPSIDCSFET